MKQYERDEIRLNELRQKINEEARNALLAKEAIEIAERHRRKADNQRLAIRDLLAKKLEQTQTDIVRCKDCKHANECYKSVHYTRNEPNTIVLGYLPIEWCSRGERSEEWTKKK